MQPHLIRLAPRSDLKRSLLAYCAVENIETCVIISAVGSLSEAVLRIANAAEHLHKMGPFELTSLSGTISQQKAHLHCSLYDQFMNSVGGHVLEGCLVYTTMEVCILALDQELTSTRIFDPETGYDELSVIMK